MKTYIADIEGDSLREVVLYIDHLAEIAALKEELRLALLRGDSLDRVVGECGQREIALQAENTRLAAEWQQTHDWNSKLVTEHYTLKVHIKELQAETDNLRAIWKEENIQHDAEVLALQARVKDLEAFATNIGDCGYVKDCRRIKELEGALNCKPQMEAKP